MEDITDRKKAETHSRRSRLFWKMMSQLFGNGRSSLLSKRLLEAILKRCSTKLSDKARDLLIESLALDRPSVSKNAVIAHET